MIGRMRKNNCAARAATTLSQFVMLFANENDKIFEFAWIERMEDLLLCVHVVVEPQLWKFHVTIRQTESKKCA